LRGGNDKIDFLLTPIKDDLSAKDVLRDDFPVRQFIALDKFELDIYLINISFC
jgi:hypothetical protein